MNPERRAQPRYAVSFPVQIRVVSGGVAQSFPATALNVSQTAMELDCDAAALKYLQSQGNYPQTCELLVPLPAVEEEILVRCHLQRFRRLSQHRYQLVLGFVDRFPMPVEDLSR